MSWKYGPDCMFRISCFENNKQNGSSHLELVISESGQFFAYYLSKYTAKNWLFSKITRSRWQEENNRLLFSITGIDHQGLIVYNFCWESQWNNIITLSQKKVFFTFKLAFSMLQYWNFQNIGFFRSSPKAQFGPEKNDVRQNWNVWGFWDTMQRHRKIILELGSTLEWNLCWKKLY